MTAARFSHYRVEGEIGRGGMGVVYRAFDERLQRMVALKVLANEIAVDPHRRQSVLDEARASSALAHPVVTTIHEIGEEGDTLFIVMELVAGTTLRARITEGPIGATETARIALQLADALAAAHQHGVIHGDVKPENVILRSDGTVKLLDFGIARRVALETATFTRISIETMGAVVLPASIAGTLPYMAPELVAGGPGDARADLYALGVLLYECLSQRRPFAAPTPALLVEAILSGTAAPVASVAPGVPPPLARIVDKLIALRPSDRYPDARALHADLSSRLRDLELEAILPAAVLGRRAVAVLPFALLTPDPAHDYLGGALADAVINHLSRADTLLVRPTATVMRYAGRPVDPLHAGRELNVETVVDGSIQKVGTRLRVHVQARDVRDGSTVLSARHDADAADLFGLQDAVAESIGGVLGLQSRTEAEVEPPTANAAAYELYLRAAERLSRYNRWDTRTAIDMLEDATRLDPRFADAWARLAEACANMHLSFEPGRRWHLQARTAIRRALALNADNALAHAAQGRILWNPTVGFKVRAALRATASALALNPVCLPAWTWQGVLFQHLGLQNEARRSLMAALSSYPNDTFAVPFIGQTYFAEGDYDGAQDFTERALVIDRSNLYANLFLPVIELYRGRRTEFISRLRESRERIGDDPLFVACEALQAAKDGRVARARALVKKALTARSLVHTHHTVHLAAAMHAVIGEPARSVALLRKAATIGLPSYTGFRDDPHFEALHGYGPFLTLMAALKKECASYQREFGSAVSASS
jgi:eukaryotic-like serine/threonine-protein kinase